MENICSKLIKKYLCSVKITFNSVCLLMIQLCITGIHLILKYIQIEQLCDILIIIIIIIFSYYNILMCINTLFFI